MNYSFIISNYPTEFHIVHIIYDYDLLNQNQNIYIFLNFDPQTYEHYKI